MVVTAAACRRKKRKKRELRGLLWWPWKGEGPWGLLAEKGSRGKKKLDREWVKGRLAGRWLQLQERKKKKEQGEWGLRMEKERRGRKMWGGCSFPRERKIRVRVLF